MTQSIKTFLIVIGTLSFISGVFLAFNGSDFSEYFSGIFIGIVLVGTVFFYNEDKTQNK